MTIRVVPFVMRFLIFCLMFFAAFASSESCKKEKTLALIKPDGELGNYSDQIKKAIRESGFDIIREKLYRLDKDVAESFYAEHSSRSFYSSLVEYMMRSHLATAIKNLLRYSFVIYSGIDLSPSLFLWFISISGPVWVMVLEKENAVSDWRTLIGPTDARQAKITHPHSIRAMCGVNMEKNCVHGSDSHQSAKREISFFFKEISSGFFGDFLLFEENLRLSMSWAGPEDISLSTSLANYLDKKLIVLLRDGRKLLGTLCSFDQFANAVLEGACERVVVGDLYSDIPLGLYVIRGENVVLIGELDLEREELPPHMTRVSTAEIKRAQKAEREASDLKGTMRKRMEFLDFD